jgi:hypothetical protein
MFELPRDKREQFRLRFESREQKSHLTQSEVLHVFGEIVQEMALRIQHVEPKIDCAGQSQAMVRFREDGVAQLLYCDYYLNTLSKPEIRAVLSHEACHVATVPSSRVPYDDEASRFVNWFNRTLYEIYLEWLAHQEFLQRFRQDVRFELYRSIKIADFDSYGEIVGLVRAGLLPAVEGLYTILNDAIFFPIIGDKSFEEWAAANDLSESVKLLEWLVEDFRYVESLNLDLLKRFIKFRNISIFSLKVESDSLMSANRIRFANPPPSMRDDAKLDIDPVIEKNWRERMASKVP